jgi:hypothetical protein
MILEQTYRSLGDIWLLCKYYWKQRERTITIDRVAIALERLVRKGFLFSWFCKDVKKRVYFLRTLNESYTYQRMTGLELTSEWDELWGNRPGAFYEWLKTVPHSDKFFV